MLVRDVMVIDPTYTCFILKILGKTLYMLHPEDLGHNSRIILSLRPFKGILDENTWQEVHDCPRPMIKVYLGSHAHGSQVTEEYLDRVTDSHYDFLGSFLGSKEIAKESIIYSYTRHINGFAAQLDEEEAAEIAKNPKVVSVFLNRGRKLQTTHSWEFMLQKINNKVIPNSLWDKARFGEDTIIANLDTGVWPESQSFSDKGFGAVSSNWKGGCVNDHGHNAVTCNRKLIGARYFNKGYLAYAKSINYSVASVPNSARDLDGHGTHTLSTAGGNFVPGASVLGVGNGTASGGSPLARVASYKASVQLGNGLNLMGTSLSKGLPENKLYPLMSAGDAALPGVAVEDALLCKSKSLDPKKVKGKILACLRGETARVAKGEESLLAGAVGMILCNDKLSGNEIIADAHVLPASQINYTDGVAVFAYINSTKDPKGYITSPKAVLGTKPAPFMAAFSSRGPNTITPEILKPDITAPGVNIIAAYSEAVSPTGEPFDKRTIPFNVESGTSMSCPHVSGVVGLLKTLYPSWSTAAIRSAIMTTARTKDNTGKPMLDASYLESTPFSHGAGHIRPNRAMDPGLVYDLTINEYLDFLCALGYNQTLIAAFADDHECPKNAMNIYDFNYPSISIANLSVTTGSSVTVTRRVKNVGAAGTYAARLIRPDGVTLSVEPNVLKFENVGEEKSFKVTLKAKGRAAGIRILKAKKKRVPKRYVFGGINWSDGKHYDFDGIRRSLVDGSPLKAKLAHIAA
ncbi:hypothetical protein FEM48_Zijuj01G0091700 [Ziziphus jujuba var. spinosa]|uniref:Subtilisin-like protease SBT5.3 n=1 Tax=Ziziphus jujuba var. spinosa TaxID=714518 RepID=A0A978W0D3_ZIZJJ|nr:hypothetical protein FEM48_Zijuj01G0091700 [Ziziphus jujuba var. spinosa]